MTKRASKVLEAGVKTFKQFKSMLVSNEDGIGSLKKNFVMTPGFTLLQLMGNAHCVVTFQNKISPLSLVYGWKGINVKDQKRSFYCLDRFGYGMRKRELE